MTTHTTDQAPHGPPPRLRKQPATGATAPPRRRTAAGSAAPAVFDPADKEPVNWPRKCALRLAGIAGIGYGASLLLHTLVLVVLYVWILDELQSADQMTINSSEVTGVPVEFEDDPGEISLGEAKHPDQPQTALNRAATARTLIKVAELPADLQDAVGRLAREGDGAEGGGEKIGAVPKGGAPPAGAVTKGSFTAWTNPRNPDVGQSYLIVIQVKLPKDIKRYKSTDLSGRVQGTDGHNQAIPWDRAWPGAALMIHPRSGRLTRLRTNGYLPIKDRTTRLIVRVPGANEAKIRDTIVISSRLLKEKQQLELEFDSAGASGPRSRPRP